ncbi:MAG: efflux RND transporter permease subunit, partial [Candidatus Rokubacteria bacterium]|nr:efflux RND transporter permease subunit [Candidatus Rokubacteria bacterium]
MTRFLAGFVGAFVDSKLTPLVVVAALLLGGFAVLATPREEEPQIVVPMMDVVVDMPGASIAEVEQRVTVPLEKKVAEIPGVEYVYSIAMPGSSLTIVRFHVGEDQERSMVRLSHKLSASLDLLPPGASPPLVKPRSIDDVPILALTLWSDRVDHATLRRIAAELDGEIKAVADVAETTLIGGPRRQLRVTPDPARMAAFRLDPVRLIATIERGNREARAGRFASGDREHLVNVGAFLGSADDVARLVVGTSGGRPVYLRDVARVDDGPEEPRDYVFYKITRAGMPARDGRPAQGGAFPAVTLAVAKRKGTNAVVVADQVLAKVDALRGTLIPPEVRLAVTRNAGETAGEKSNELLEHLAIAVVSVTMLIAVFLGWRAALVVVVAVPVTLAITLFVYYLYGYTLNRVTLFALIFSIGILVDDPIVGVENIVRHFRLPANRGRSPLAMTVEAITEVGSPLILATFAVIFAIVPLAFVRGLMGPYMRPIPIGASTAMLLSMAASFVVTPWAAYRLLRRGDGGGRREPAPPAEGWTMRLYRRLMTPLVRTTWLGLTFLAVVTLLLVVAASLVLVKAVRVKMLPFDDKSELQVVVDLPEGATLEHTARATRAVADAVAGVPEVTGQALYVGTASPYNFNGLVRHYFLRRAANVADIHVNLVPKGERAAQSHDVARRIRTAAQPVAQAHGARLKVAEVPPGPPVLQTLVAEVYGPDYPRQIALARQVLQVFETTPGVVDADWYVEDAQPMHRVVLDKEKAALNGVETEHVARLLSTALDGAAVGLLHLPAEKEDVPIVVRVGRAARSSMEDLAALRVASASGALVPLGELVRIEDTTESPSVYRKNGRRVVYVTGDVAGEEESPVYAILELGKRLDALRAPEGYPIERRAASAPFLTDRLSLKWDGEWQVTLEVFRDLGLAFGAVTVLIYVLVVGWFRSFRTPLVILAPVPLSLIGILPAHWLLGAFFTATSMIGFIAGAGIVVRNSIILVDFAELRRREGMALADAVIDAGAVRFRPMLLTASAVVVGSTVILFDPIFQGLAISLMAGEVASTLLSRMAVPILYHLAERRRERRR